jgi:hypothetical protein
LSLQEEHLVTGLGSRALTGVADCLPDGFFNPYMCKCFRNALCQCEPEWSMDAAADAGMPHSRDFPFLSVIAMAVLLSMVEVYWSMNRSALSCMSAAAGVQVKYMLQCLFDLSRLLFAV